MTGVRRLKPGELPTRTTYGPINDTPEYKTAMTELEKPLNGQVLEVCISPDSAKRGKIKRPAMSMVQALKRVIESRGLKYRVTQVKVNGEPWARVYISEKKK